MTQEEKEGNRIIAEFMGGVDKHWFEEMLEYHMDWNWLMPVVEKIESIRGIEIIIRHLGCEIFYLGKTIGFGLEKNKKDSVFKAVVQFINWYNQSKK